MWSRSLPALAVLLLGAVMVGCDRGPTGPEPLAPGIHPELSIRQAGPPEVVLELRLKRVEIADRVSSFQAALHVDAEGATLEEVTLPDGVMGDWNQSEDATVRFAAVRTDGMVGDPVVQFRFSAGSHLPVTAFRLEIEEVVSAADFADLTPLVATPTAARFQQP